jgi:SAM-dependent methyltransferase
VYAWYERDERVGTRWAGRNAGNRAIGRERVRVLQGVLRDHGLLPLAGRDILDVGCGAGRALAELLRWGASRDTLHGIDLLPVEVERARRTLPGVDVCEGNAEQLPFDDASFDVVTLFTVFTSILDDDMQRNVAREVHRVVRPGGSVAWYDFRVANPYNRNVRGMSRAAIRRLFPGWALDLRPLTLLPPLARRLGPATPVLYPALTRLPFLLTHYAGLVTRPPR